MIENDDLVLYMQSLKEQKKQRDKKRLEALLNKYGSKEGINQHGSLEETIEVLFSGGDKLLDEVIAEREAKALEENEKNKTTHKREDTLFDKLAESVATSDMARKTALAMQGIAESKLNPAGLMMRGYNYTKGKGFETGLEHIEPTSLTEMALESVGQELYDEAMLATIGGKIGSRAYIGAERYLGKRNLRHQLMKGHDFKDINFGRVDKKRLEQINSVRREIGVEEIKSGKVNLPKDRVEHIYERRILNDHYSPQDATQNIYDALYGKNSEVSATRYNTLQKVEHIEPTSLIRGRAVVGKSRYGDNIFVKTGYKK